jgi:hypothetical protein
MEKAEIGTGDFDRDGKNRGSTNDVIPPLRKRSKAGVLYQRDLKILSLIGELRNLPRDELVRRASISNRSEPGYVPGECLVHFVRTSRNDVADAWFERLYRILSERVLRAMPRAEGVGGTESLARGTVREEAHGRFTELLAQDRQSYAEKLDFYEVRFDRALDKLRIDAQRKVSRIQRRTESLQLDPESGEIAPEIEMAAGAYDPFEANLLDQESYRLRLDAAIKALPPEQARIIYMLKKGFPIDSKDPGVDTIAKILCRSEKTIRTHRDKALVTLKKALEGGGRR